MTLADLGNIGEFVAAIAVLLSLLYLAIQIRQNTKSVRTSTYHAVLDSSHRVNEYFADPRTERIYRVGRKDPSQLGEDELAQFKALVGNIVGFHEALFLRTWEVQAAFWLDVQVRAWARRGLDSALLSQALVQSVAVVGPVADQALGRGREEPVVDRLLDDGDLMG